MLVSYDNQVALENAIKKSEEEVQAAVDTKNLNTKFQSTQTVTRWVRETARHHNTLCGHSNCYSTCHEHCNLEKSFDKEVFKYCWALQGETCRICHHSYKIHFHDEVKMVQKTEKREIIDESMRSKFYAAKSTEEQAALLKSSLKFQKRNSEKKRKDLSAQLLLTIEEFHQLGLNRNYSKVLENQLYVVEQRLEGDDSAATSKNTLRDTHTQLKKKLDLVQRTMQEPWSPQADESTRKNWAYKVMMLDVKMPLSKVLLDKTFKSLSLQVSKGDDEQFQKVQIAYDIIKQYIQ